MAQFGLQIEPQFGFSYAEIRDLARLCESTGFNSLWCSDHLFLDERSEERDCWECWTALAGLAVETSTLRIGSLVSCVSYRYPSVLAKMAACVDVMSGGRLEFGIGAGWKRVEYDAYGIAFPSPRERVDRLVEALPLILALWTEPRATFQGRYYQVTDAVCAPKPVQQPRPPVWVGGSGRRVLGLAAQYADGVNIGGFPSPERYRERLEELRGACERVGRDFDSIKKSQFMGVLVAGDQAGLDRVLAGLAREQGATVEEARARYRGFIGRPEEVTGFLREYTALGVEQFMLMFPYGYEAESVRLMAERVLPEL